MEPIGQKRKAARERTQKRNEQLEETTELQGQILTGCCPNRSELPAVIWGRLEGQISNLHYYRLAILKDRPRVLCSNFAAQRCYEETI